MPHIQKSVMVPYSTSAMYPLVEDVSRYHEFLPWCSGAQELQRSPSKAWQDGLSDLPVSTQDFVMRHLNGHIKPRPQDKITETTLTPQIYPQIYERIAQINIAYMAIKTSFTTINQCLSPLLITVQLDRTTKSPFKLLEGSWSFIPIGSVGSRIMVDMRYEFANILLDKTLGRVFSVIIENFAQSFVTRAHALFRD